MKRKSVSTRTMGNLAHLGNDTLATSLLVDYLLMSKLAKDEESGDFSVDDDG